MALMMSSTAFSTMNWLTLEVVKGFPYGARESVLGRDRKLDRIGGANPDIILSSNVGCIRHPQCASDTPITHWIEWVDRRLAS
jgi:hypothetical protein